jgi:molecular chaperone GrpE
VIGTVMRQGYRLGDGPVLRHAMVGVVDSVGDTTDAGAVDGAQDDGENSESER